jgi:hypothetical protein
MIRIPRRKRHELMLLWCRMPTGMALVRKLRTKAWATVSGVEERLGGLLGVRTPATDGTEHETWDSLFVAQLIDANVKRVVIVGATANDEITDTIVERVRSADCAIEVVSESASTASFDCIVIGKAALVTALEIDSLSSARVLVVCDTTSFDGYRIVSDALSSGQWELIGSAAAAGDGCVVFRRRGESQARGGWEILDVLHRLEATREAREASLSATR